MIVYTTALLLIASYTYGLPLTSVNVSVASSLHRLASVCKNPFLVSQIQSKFNEECNVVVPPYTETAYQCLMFYDMNLQLCTATTSSKLSIAEEDFSVFIPNQPLDVVDICKAAKVWHVTNLPDYPKFKPTVERVFQNDNFCVKVCGVPEVTSSEANFFCKYFNWGVGLLNSIQSTNITSSVKETGSTAGNSAVLGGSAAANLKPAPQISSQSMPQHNQISTNNTEQTLNNIVKVESSAKTDNSDNEIKDAKPTQPIKKLSEDVSVPKPEQNNVAQVQQSSAEPAEDQSIDGGENMDKPILAGLEPAVLTKTIIPEAKPNPLQNVAPVGTGNLPNIDKIKKPVADVELGDQDYQDQDIEEGKEGLADMQGGDDGDDPSLLEQENKVQEEAKIPSKVNTPVSYASDKGVHFHKKSMKRIIPPMTVPALRRQQSKNDVYTNSFADAYSDGDDHFFPFFLTSIVLIALLYILYHNKNKVSKVVLGLIVEGRQNGRRRNSRGHSYRRLDTLEQAMNAPTAAAPSKIIY